MLGRMVLLALSVVVGGCATAPESGQSGRSSPASERAEKARSQLEALMDSDAGPAAEHCTRLSRSAAKTMNARQGGVPMSQLSRNRDGTRRDLAEQGVPAEHINALAGLYRRMLIDAYGKPRYHTARDRKRSISEFESKWRLECKQVLNR